MQNIIWDTRTEHLSAAHDLPTYSRKSDSFTISRKLSQIPLILAFRRYASAKEFMHFKKYR